MNILCGYNVNIDSVYRISGTEISELLETFKAAEMLNKIQNPPGKIYSEADFVAGLTYCMKNGCGAEWLIINQSVFEFLKNRYFGKSLVRMGGNAGIMANALSQIGVSRVIPNVAVSSKTQLSLFSKKTIYFPENLPQAMENTRKESDGDKNVFSSSQEPIHFVFDFSEGEVFSLYGTEIRVPRENRFIATWDHLNLRLFVNPAFEQYALQHACEIDGVLVSGFHLLLENYPDGKTYKTILDDTFNQLKSWKNRNDKLQIHIEFGHFASKEIANSVFLKFAKFSDSLGMNEDELEMLYNLHGITREGLQHMEAEAISNAAFRLASKYGLKKLLIHTREFVLIAFKTDLKFNSKSCPELEHESETERELQKAAEEKLEALKFGVICAGVYAASGKLEGREFVEKEASKLQESQFGRAQIDSFLKAFNGKTLGQDAYVLKENYIICILPTMLSRSPVTTVGLGDTLIAGTFLRGLELDVQA
jgi:ADP-dependent phosphofructokinase/glucokinase